MSSSIRRLPASSSAPQSRFSRWAARDGQDRKKARLVGEPWRDWVRRTSFIPFGRGLASPGGFALIGGTVLWLGATWAHGALGYRPAGIWAFFALSLFGLRLSHEQEILRHRRHSRAHQRGADDRRDRDEGRPGGGRALPARRSPPPRRDRQGHAPVGLHDGNGDGRRLHLRRHGRRPARADADPGGRDADRDRCAPIWA